MHVRNQKFAWPLEGSSQMPVIIMMQSFMHGWFLKYKQATNFSNPMCEKVKKKKMDLK